MPPRRSKVDPRFSRKTNPEKIISRNMLQDFQIEGSRGKEVIEQMLQQKVEKASRVGLIQLGNIISGLIDVKISRNHKRKKDLIIKWFDENADLIEPLVPKIKVDFVDLNDLQVEHEVLDDNNIDMNLGIDV
ncbi:hypothetical protein M9Y10_036134 [Tritrichomonas musculus]|uniref:Uncharacterized protein n=1 Tax=Tritrichomonas musculus TaxID=1915356 RepID=A0ABR2GVA9_9EUKA